MTLDLFVTDYTIVYFSYIFKVFLMQREEISNLWFLDSICFIFL
jgi:hypothetical protein